jgi:hypothetical protein
MLLRRHVPLWRELRLQLRPWLQLRLTPISAAPRRTKGGPRLPCLSDLAQLLIEERGDLLIVLWLGVRVQKDFVHKHGRLRELTRVCGRELGIDQISTSLQECCCVEQRGLT